MAEIEFRKVSFRYPDSDEYVFRELDLTIEKGITSFVGQNGTGKTTLLLLAAGLLLPESGTVYLAGQDTRTLADHQERQRFVSFIYQNMEFETEDSIGALLQFVYANGFHSIKTPEFLAELIEVFELSGFINRKTQEISKGELQRTIMAFSLLYGSSLLIMDEPIFAMEEHQKIKTMKYLVDYAHKTGISIVYSAHELDITRHFSEYLCLFYKDTPPIIGTTQLLYTEENLEKVFNIPYAMLKQKEYLFRESLLAQIPSRQDKTVIDD